MGFLNPATGEWVNDDGTIAPTGMIGQQDTSTGPGWIPPPQPGPEAPPPWLGGPPAPPPGETQLGLSGQPNTQMQVGEPSPAFPNDIMPISPEFSGQEPGMPAGANAMPEIQNQDVTIRTGKDIVPQDGNVGEPEPMGIPGGLPDIKVGEPTIKTGSDMTPQPKSARVNPDNGPPTPVSSTPGNELAQPAPESEPPASAGTGAPDLPGAVPPADMKLKPPGLIADEVANGAPGGPAMGPGESATAPKGPGMPQTPPDTIAGLTAAEVENRRAQEELDAKEAVTKAAHANNVAQLKTQAAKDADTIISRGENELQAARNQQREDFDKYKAMGEKNVWGDNPTRNMVLAGIAILLGGRNGANAVIGAVEGLEEKKKTELAMQEKVMAQDGKNAEQIKEHTNAQLADWNVRKAAGLDATAARAEAELAAQGVPQSEIASNKDILAIKSKGLEAQQKADQLAHKNAEDGIHDALANRKADLEAQLAQAKLDAIAKKNRANAAAGAGGGGVSKGAMAVSKAIEDGVVGDDGKRRPLTWSEKQQVAAANGVPEDGKAGHTTLTSINARIAFDANQTIKGNRQGLQETKAIDTESKNWAKQNGLDAISKQQRELSALQKQLADNPHNPLQQALAVEKAVSAARGGAASKQALALALGHLGGSLDNAEAVITKIRDGEISPKQMENFRGFINGQRGSAQEEGKVAYDNYNKYIATQPPERQTQLLASRGRLFSGLDGFGGKENASEAGATEKPSNGPAPLKVTTASDKALMIKARATKPGDPNYASAQSWLAAHGVQ